MYHSVRIARLEWDSIHIPTSICVSKSGASTNLSTGYGDALIKRGLCIFFHALPMNMGGCHNAKKKKRRQPTALLVNVMKRPRAFCLS